MRIKSGFRLRDVAGEKVVTAEGPASVNFNKMVVLNETAAFLWDSLIGKSFDVKDATELLIANYGADRKIARKDAEALIDSWKSIGLVE